MRDFETNGEINNQEHLQPKQKKVLIVGSGGISQRTTEIVNRLHSDNIEVVDIKDLKENGLSLQDVIIDNSDLISEQRSYPIHMLPRELPTVNYSHSKRTDGERLKDHGIDSLDRLLEECILISNKQSKLPKSIRDLVVKYSLEAYKELNLKAEEIKKEKEKMLTSLDEVLDSDRIKIKDNSYQKLKESLENNTKEDDRKEQ